MPTPDKHPNPTDRGSAAPQPARAAAAVSYLLGLGFGLPGLYGIWHLATDDRVATVLGFPTNGGGPFESIGIDTSAALQAGFLAVCSAEIGTGLLLWTGRRFGPASAVALLPFELAYWVGFALPLGPILGLARSLLLARSLRSNRNLQHSNAPGRPPR